MRPAILRTLLCYIFIQATGWNCSFRAEGGRGPVSETTVHQRSANRSDRGIPSTRWHICCCFSGKSKPFRNCAIDYYQPKQIAALLDIQEWQKRNDAARMADQQALNERLLQLETNQQQMMETLRNINMRGTWRSDSTTVYRYAPTECHGSDGVAETTSGPSFRWRSRTAILLSYAEIPHYGKWTSGRGRTLDDHVL